MTKTTKSEYRVVFGSRISNWEQRSDALGLASDVILDQDLFDILKYWDYCCAYCGEPLDSNVEFDHAIPLSAKFSEDYISLNCVDNLVCSCPTCNRKKSDKHYEDFADIRTIQSIEDWQIMMSEVL